VLSVSVVSFVQSFISLVFLQQCKLCLVWNFSLYSQGCNKVLKSMEKILAIF